MFSSEVMTTVFPYVTFTCMATSTTFCIHRDRILHTETYENKDSGEKDPSITFVNFAKPDPTSSKMLFAKVDMPIDVFRDTVLRPAYAGT